MFEECECGQGCPLCEDCGKPICECTCFNFDEEENEESEW